MDKPSEILAKVINQLIDLSALNDTCKALESGTLQRDSSPIVINSIFSSNTQVQDQIKNLQNVWTCALPNLGNAEFALVLRCCAESVKLARKDIPQIEFVWTGPHVEGSYLRSTRQVVKDIIQGSKSELLIVGYWLTAYEENGGIIKELIDMIASAAKSGVKVRMILDKGKKNYGIDNLEVITELWHKDVHLPEIYTWKTSEDDKHLKLHAKILVADRYDALVTSANLTMHAMDRNMEMGVRFVGYLSSRIVGHFDLLIANHILVRYD